MLNEVANIIRGLSADGVEKANSGHPGLPLGCAEIGSVLYGTEMSYDPSKSDWPNRDRFVLSAGHGSMFLYSLLHLSGFDVSLEDLKEFRQLDSKTPGHPECDETDGVETTTGPLGQGFANAVGMAVSERMLAERYNTADFEIVNHYTYTLLGDGGMMEGIVSEAASLAGHLGLGKLIAIYDDNEISIGGDTDITFTEDVPTKFKACDWHVIDGVDGHDPEAIKAAFAQAKEVTDKPSLIVAETKIGFGAPNKEGESAAHGAPLGEEEIKGMKENLGLPVDKDFYVSKEVRNFFAQRREELKEERKAWEAEFTKWAKANPELKEKWDTAHNQELPADLRETIADLKIETPIATRKASGATLRKIADEVDYLVGGSADLAPSNKTYLNKYDEIQAGEYQGRNFRFGVREHAMAAMANGIVLHGGLRPFVSTFLVFSDYMRGAIRLSALMKQPVVYVLTHDSIYVGEDGPTHEPIEHVESLRLIPNLNVIRPADAAEAKAAWIQAMERTDGPTVLVLTRQNLPNIEKEDASAIYKGGYVVSEAADADVTLMASGSEVSLAVEVAKELQTEGKVARIVSIPDRDKFLAQGSDYVAEVLGDQDILRVAMEVGVGQGWYQFLQEGDHLVSMDQFGASGPGAEVAQKFGFEAKEITKDIMTRLQ
ncbi:transketolase [Halobacteroides halobius DSM 5150]|uniref:Transketolase n=1 Tax=Halobacteroides halobius (strain ATCC 35273 / DSM 5150 / MD-1) TaxID=748449 RepID=L0KBB3_HALHC|nr:transketolase [Halobacteroides halobius]AGB41674.1 transketolase [Halobacteroides halobius DSM 5150]